MPGQSRRPGPQPTTSTPRSPWPKLAGDEPARVARLSRVSAADQGEVEQLAADDRKFFTQTIAANQGTFTARDWALFLSVAGIWGSSFLFIVFGLEALQPGVVTLLRVGAGAAALALVPRQRVAIE